MKASLTITYTREIDQETAEDLQEALEDGDYQSIDEVFDQWRDDVTEDRKLHIPHPDTG